MPSTPPPIRYAPLARRLPEETIDLRQVIDGHGAIELEIGFGRGRFLLERAAAAPESRVLGVEIKPKWAHLVEVRRAREGLHNAAAFAGDIREILPRCGPDHVLQRAFIHFPDPWWKKRHTKRRVLDPVLLVQLGRLLKSGGELFVQTDVIERADTMREDILSAPDFTIVPCEQNPYGARSNREARADEDGLPVYRILALRKSLEST